MRQTIHPMLLMVSACILANCAAAPAPETTEQSTGQEDQSKPERQATLDVPNLQDDPKAAAHELVDRALRCGDECGDGETVGTLLEKAIELDPTLAEAYDPLAWFYATTGGRDRPMKHKAMEVCRRLLEALPDDPRTYMCLSRYAGDIGVEERERLARKAVEVGPDNGKAHGLLALVLYHRKHLRHRPGGVPPRTEDDEKVLDEAIVHYRRYLELDPYRGPGGEQSPLYDYMLFLSGILHHGQRYKEASDLLTVLIDKSGGSLRNRRWCETIERHIFEFSKRQHDLDLYEYEAFRPAVAKYREHCENPDLERAVALLEKANHEGKVDEAIAAWEPLFDDERFVQDAYYSLSGLYGEKVSFYGKNEYKDKLLALSLKYFERASDHLDRCEALRSGDFRYLLPELSAELQQECGLAQNTTRESGNPD